MLLRSDGYTQTAYMYIRSLDRAIETDKNRIIKSTVYPRVLKRELREVWIHRPRDCSPSFSKTKAA